MPVASPDTMPDTTSTSTTTILTHMSDWASAEGSKAKGNLLLSTGILLSTLPEALPVGTLVLALLFMDRAFAVFGAGMLIACGIGWIVGHSAAPPDTYSLQQCAPWKSQATMRALAESMQQMRAAVGSTTSSNSGVWVSASLTIIAYACVYAMTSMRLLNSTFDSKIATYANATIPAATIACIATLLGFVCFRYFAQCENFTSIAVSLLIGGGVGGLWAWGMWAADPELANLVHIPRVPAPGNVNASLFLCASGGAGTGT